jgi:hypothetical protein
VISGLAFARTSSLPLVPTSRWSLVAYSRSSPRLGHLSLVSTGKEDKYRDRARDPEESANALGRRPGLRVRAKGGNNNGPFSSFLDEAGLVILYEREPNMNYKYTTRVETRRKEVEGR